jgi:hypothetical protein
MDATLIPIPLAGGLDETQDDALVPMDKSRLCQNVVFPDPTTAAKRPGLVSIGNVANGRKLVPHSNEVLVLDGQNAWGYAPSQSGFIEKGPAPQCLVSRRFVASGNLKLPASEVAANTQYPIAPRASIAEDPATHLQVMAWCDGSSIQAAIYDPVAGSFVMGATVVSTFGVVYNPLSFNPRVVIVGQYAYVLYYNPIVSTSSLQYSSISLTGISAGWTSRGPTPYAIYPGTCWDACFCTLTVGGVSTPSVAVTNVDASGNANLYYMNVLIGTLLTAYGPLVYLTTKALQVSVAASLSTDATNVVSCIVYDNTPEVSFFSFQGTTASPVKIAGAVVATSGLSATTVRALGLVRTGYGAAGSTGTWVYSISGDGQVSPAISGGTRPVARSTTVIQYGVVSTDVTSAVGYAYGPFLGYQGISKPVMATVNGEPCCYQVWIWQDGQRYDSTQAAQLQQTTAPSPSTTGTTAQTIVLVQLSTTGAGSSVNPSQAPTPVGVLAPRFAGYMVPANFEAAPFTTTLPNGMAAVGFTALGCESDQALDTSITALKVDFQDPGIGQNVRLGDWTWMAGALPLIYDGSVITEAGFINQPPAPAISLPASGSPVVPMINDLTYVLCYAQQDLNGNIHRSPPSIPSIVDASAGYSEVRLGIVPLAITFRQASLSAAGSPVQIEIYRNSSNAPGTLQLVTTIPNDPTQQFITFNDEAADNSNATSPILYTTGGGVPSDGPPNLSALAVHSDRIFGVSEDGQTAYFTTQYVRGEAPRFTDAFTMTWPQGPLTALWSLEQRLHASTADDIFYIFGDGPNDNGAGSDFTTPSMWQESLGVTDSRGVVLFPGGALLSTSKGIYIEDRSGTFAWQPQIRRTLAANPIITGMTAIDAFGTIRINAQVEDGMGQGGLSFHMDYRHGKWATHIPSLPRTVFTGVLSSCVAGGSYYALLCSSTEGLLLQESASTNLDGPSGSGGWVTSTINTGWITASGVQGFYRLHRTMSFGVQSSPCGVSVAVDRDYNPSFDAPLTMWTDEDLSGLTVLQLQATASPQKVEATSFQVVDYAPTTLPVGTGAGPIWKNLLVTLRAKRGLFRQQPGVERR